MFYDSAEIGFSVLVDYLLVAHWSGRRNRYFVSPLWDAVPLNIVKPWMLHQLVAILFCAKSVIVVFQKQAVHKVNHLKRYARQLLMLLSHYLLDEFLLVSG